MDFLVCFCWNPGKIVVEQAAACKMDRILINLQFWSVLPLLESREWGALTYYPEREMKETQDTINLMNLRCSVKNIEHGIFG